MWLIGLGAEVHGASIGVPTSPSHFEAADLSSDIVNHQVDIRSIDAVQELVAKVQPDYVFNLAAQAIVRAAYDDPVYTITTNAIGTLNVLESLRQLSKKCAAIMITSDKCYENVEQCYGYRESDRLGGKDPYSASKAAAEIFIWSYFNSFFSDKESNIRVASVRAGNVIGGGDWASDRLIPDMVRAWSNNEYVTVRNPLATRPWQLVLEPLSGYLLLGSILYSNTRLNGSSFNFGPKAENIFSVESIVTSMAERLTGLTYNIEDQRASPDGPYEATLLKLSCDKALHYLSWSPILNYEETIELTASWYHHFYTKGQAELKKFSLDQIGQYELLAAERGQKWFH